MDDLAATLMLVFLSNSVCRVPFSEYVSSFSLSISNIDSTVVKVERAASCVVSSIKPEVMFFL